MSHPDKISPELTALATQYLGAEEVIHSWQRHEELFVARLITRELAALCQDSPRRRSMGGCGRTLSFVRRNDQWEMIGEGGWIS